MPLVNFLTKQIQFKIVYYGTGLGGKTTNLKFIHSQIIPSSRSDLVMMATESERTLYFDFMGLDLGKVQGMQLKFALYTVPGQQEYGMSRKLLLHGVDGIVFVADSAIFKREENIESMKDMIQNLKIHKRDENEIPLVLQYNKRDLNNILPLEVLESDLNPRKVPSFEACALEGKGVFSTLKSITKEVCTTAMTE